MSEVRSYNKNNYFKKVLFADESNAKPVNIVVNNERYWEKEAMKLDWFNTWDSVTSGESPYVKWFDGGELNASYNCIDRHVKSWRRNKAAIIFEGEPGDKQVLTYYDLYREVNKFANVLKRMRIQKGDIVTIYMPMIPEAVISILACARIGAPHSVVFGGFSSNALKERINDSESKLVITVDGYWRRGSIVPAKTNVDKAVDENQFVKNVIVVKRTTHHIYMEKDRDYWYNELMDWSTSYCEPEKMNSEDTLFLLYTSGTTGKPKGVVHTTGGYLTGVYSSFEKIFNVNNEDVYWCTADVGWITGHSYIAYGPLLHGATMIIYEGSPDYPEKDRMWNIIEKYGVSIFYTSPTNVRMFMKWGESWFENKNISSLRLLGSVGEPINREAWNWFFDKIGKGKCPIVDTWWQTETGSIMISPIPGVTPLKPGSATKPLMGVDIDIVNEEGKSVPNGDSGYLVIKTPCPSMLRNIYKNNKRYEETYWNFIEGMYFTGDGAYRDEDGYIWITGRVDDVINISGHRVGSAEIESAALKHNSVAEIAAIGCNDNIKGSVICLFVSLKEGNEPSDNLTSTLKEIVVNEIGKFAKPEKVYFVRELPKTRSGKIMRRVLKNIVEEKELGDLTTLMDLKVIDELIKKC